MARGAYRWRFSGADLQSIERAAVASPGVLRVDLPREASTRQTVRPTLQRPLVIVPLKVIVLALLATTGWLWFRASRSSWARNTALPEIARLAAARQYIDAVALAGAGGALSAG